MVRPWLIPDVHGALLPPGAGLRPDVKLDAAMGARIGYLAEHFDIAWA